MKFAIRSLLALAPCLALAQVAASDYQRAQGLRDKLQGLALNIPGPVNWIDETHRFWYRKSVAGGNEFVLVDANALSKKPAFDHQKLAASLSAASGEKLKAVTLPFSEITFADKEHAIQFAAAGSLWKCSLSDYACKKSGPAPESTGFGRGRSPADDLESPAEFENDVSDGVSGLSPQQGQGRLAPAVPEQPVRVSPDKKWEA